MSAYLRKAFVARKDLDGYNKLKKAQTAYTLNYLFAARNHIKSSPTLGTPSERKKNSRDLNEFIEAGIEHLEGKSRSSKGSSQVPTSDKIERIRQRHNRRP
ncbi:MAG: hypothetical protein ACI9S8_001848 [Chlamydiales bacterium]|jgi:hypothetical protein